VRKAPNRILSFFCEKISGRESLQCNFCVLCPNLADIRDLANNRKKDPLALSCQGQGYEPPAERLSSNARRWHAFIFFEKMPRKWKTDSGIFTKPKSPRSH